MRSYLVQEINDSDMTKILKSVTEKAYKIPMEGLFWITVPQNLLSQVQNEHQHQCGPHYMALETGKDWIKLELLVRCEQKIRCDCISYATPDQREFMIEYLDRLIRNQDVRV
ncbi:MAG: hypothetical protein ACOCPS_06995 [Desulfonatronovibrio sp.]